MNSVFLESGNNLCHSETPGEKLDYLEHKVASILSSLNVAINSTILTDRDLALMLSLTDRDLALILSMLLEIITDTLCPFGIRLLFLLY